MEVQKFAGSHGQPLKQRTTLKRAPVTPVLTAPLLTGKWRTESSSPKPSKIATTSAVRITFPLQQKFMPSCMIGKHTEASLHKASSKVCSSCNLRRIVVKGKP